MIYTCENLVFNKKNNNICGGTITIFIKSLENGDVEGFCDNCFGLLYDDEEYISEEEYIKYRKLDILK